MTIEIGSDINMAELKKQGLFFDMHFHTKYSDGFSNIKSLVKSCTKKGIGVAITDHNEIKGALLASSENINLVPGIEVRSMENMDLLFYFYKISDLVGFYNSCIKPYMKRVKYAGVSVPARILIEKSKEFNSVSSLPHPFAHHHSIGKGLQKPYLEQGEDKFKVIKDLDAIEVMNGHLMKVHNLKAVDLAKKYDKCYTAGSDGHIGQDLGKVLTYSNSNNVEEFLSNILKRQNRVYYYPDGKVARVFISRSMAFRKHAVHPFYYFTRVLGFGKTKIKNGMKKIIK